MSTPLHTFAFIETEAEETARLAQAPVGSDQHFWSTLPETIHDDLHGLIIELPSKHNDRIVVTVTNIGSARSKPGDYTGPMRLDADYTCVVVASTNLSYPVGGYDITVNSAALRRGRQITV